MLKVLKNLKKSWVSVLFIIILLCIQAAADLALPDYTSKIVNDGIQAGGIDSSVPKIISKEDMDTVLIISEDDNKILESYELIGNEETSSQKKIIDKYFGKDYKVEPNSIYVLKDINLVKNGWEKHLQTYPTDIIILSKSYEIYKALNKNQNYKLVTQSPAYALFIKKELIKKNFKAPNANGKYYMDTKFDTNIDWSVE